MKTIDTISSLEGRKLLIEIFHELRYRKQFSSMRTLFISWRLCTNEKDVHKYSANEVAIAHKLGFFRGTALWMEEIVNRFYFSTINSFVYFGAAILLVLIGIRRFTEQVDDTIVIAGIIFEALMLFFLFFIMYFTPNEADYKEIEEKEEREALNELIIEIGEVSRDLTAVSIQFENMEEVFRSLIDKQEQLIRSVNEQSEKTASAVSPNPEMINIMKQTNNSLMEFKSTVDSLKGAADKLRKEEIEFAVKKEVEKFFMNKMNGGDKNTL